jgi:N,N'-diacetyllegionaminate synthase
MKSKVKIIAEIGVNHNGDSNLAFQLIDAAKSAGADIVKFQIFKADRLASKNSKKAIYQAKNNPKETQYQMLKKLELSYEMYKDILSYCKKNEIECIASAFDIDDINFLLKSGQTVFKIPSGEIVNIPYLRHIGKNATSVIMSTGMASMEEIQNAISILIEEGVKSKNLCLLHCTSEYPAPMDELNLNVIKMFKAHFGLSVGYSDHTIGIEASIAAVALGASVIEKHFTLDKRLPGPDHIASIEQNDLAMLVQAIKNVRVALGVAEKNPSPSELKNLPIVRQYIVAKKTIKKGDILNNNNITSMRTGEGISVKYWDSVLGTEAIKDFKTNEIILIDDKF